MNFLSDILESKKLRLAKAKRLRPIEDLRAAAVEARQNAKSHALLAALKNKSINIIAEIKRASPSRGTIRADADVVEFARAYESGGAVAISVLTEEDRFHGSLDDMREVRAAVSLPMLRKDFIFDEYQLYESAEAGADAILLIVAALDDVSLIRLRDIAENQLGMDALVEVHTSAELLRANSSGSRLIGINNRDLRTFEVSLNVSLQLIREMSLDALFVSESGLTRRDDLDRLHRLGYRGFLIGESLMRSGDPASALRELLIRKDGAAGK
jgi:indole-3-glycerol phosphate synthase